MTKPERSNQTTGIILLLMCLVGLTICFSCGTAHATQANLLYDWPLETNTNAFVGSDGLTNVGGIGFTTIGGLACAGPITSGQYLSMTAATCAALTGLTNYTLEFQIQQIVAAGNSRYLFDTGGDNIYVQSGDTTFNFNCGGNPVAISPISQGGWHTVDLSISNVNPKRRLWLDNNSTPLYSDNLSGTIGTFSSSTIANYTALPTIGYLNGYIRHVRIWSTTKVRGVDGCFPCDDTYTSPSPTPSNSPTFSFSPTVSPTPSSTPTFSPVATVVGSKAWYDFEQNIEDSETHNYNLSAVGTPQFLSSTPLAMTNTWMGTGFTDSNYLYVSACASMFSGGMPTTGCLKVSLFSPESATRGSGWIPISIGTTNGNMELYWYPNTPGVGGQFSVSFPRSVGGALALSCSAKNVPYAGRSYTIFVNWNPSGISVLCQGHDSDTPYQILSSNTLVTNLGTVNSFLIGRGQATGNSYKGYIDNLEILDHNITSDPRPINPEWWIANIGDSVTLAYAYPLCTGFTGDGWRGSSFFYCQNRGGKNCLCWPDRCQLHDHNSLPLV